VGAALGGSGGFDSHPLPPLPSTAERRVLSTLVILNPAAGHGRSVRFQERILAAVTTAWGAPEFALTARRGHAAELARAAVGRHERVLAVGGDGTVHEVANGLLGSGAARLPALGVVPVGTGNDFAKMTYPARLAPEAAVAALAGGAVRRFDVGRAWGEYFVNSIGVGLDAEVAQRVNLYKHWPGAAGYVVAALGAILHRRARAMQVTTDDGEWTGLVTVLEVGVGPCAGGLFYLTPDARPDDGLLDLCAIGPFGLAFLVKAGARVLRGTHGGLEGVRMSRSTRVAIAATDGPITAHFDGEVRAPGASTLEITLLPGALPVLVAA